tara:strand:- start:1055 stop:1162 length:108 start_codon:yes stop_codon:yes gene_type:complete
MQVVVLLVLIVDHHLVELEVVVDMILDKMQMEPQD